MLYGEGGSKRLCRVVERIGKGAQGLKKCMRGAADRSGGLMPVL